MSTTKQLLAAQKDLLRARMAELRAEIAPLLEQATPLQAQLDDAIARQNAAGIEVAQLAAQIDSIQQPGLHDLKQELAEIARAESAIKL
jgi:t-SNARE complex subunit (syntaxin)